MAKKYVIMIVACACLFALSGGRALAGATEEGTAPMIDILIYIDGRAYPAKLYDHETTRALIALFPLDIQMHDLNANEKYHYLPDPLPTDAQNIGTITAGDILLYGSDCLVLFYESFPTPYRYTRLGYLEDAENLPERWGDGDVAVSFDLYDTGGKIGKAPPT